MQVLSGVSTYSGGTIIDSGTLGVFPASGSGSGVGTGPVTVNAPGVLLVSGDSPLGGPGSACALNVNGAYVGDTVGGGNFYVGPVTMTGGTISSGGTLFPTDVITTNSAATTAQIDYVNVNSSLGPNVGQFTVARNPALAVDSGGRDDS